MNTLPLDAHALSINKPKQGLLIAFGFFIFLALTSFTATEDIILKDVLLNYGVKDYWIFWVRLMTEIILTISLMLLLIKKFQINKISSNKTLKKFVFISILVFVFCQVLQWIYTYYAIDLYSDAYFTNLGEYTDFNYENPKLKMIYAFSVYINYFIIGFLLIRK